MFNNTLNLVFGAARTRVAFLCLMGLVTLQSGCEHGDNHYVPWRGDGGVDERGFDVRGRVVDGLGEPLSGIKIKVDGVVTETDEAGIFSVEDVADDYDVALVAGDNESFVYRGMTERRPVFTLPGARSSEVRSATLTVEVPETDVPNVRTVLLLGAGDETSRVLIEPSRDDLFTKELRWADSDAFGVRAMAFEVEVDPATEEPIQYLRQAEITRDFVKGEAFAWKVEWSPFSITQETLETEVNPPAGHVFVSTTVSARLSEGGPYLPLFTSEEQNATFALPTIAGVRFEVSATTEGEGGTSTRRVAADPSSNDVLTLNLLDAPSELMPSNGALVSADTLLSWDNEADLFAMVQLTPRKQKGAHPSYAIFTAAQRTRFPDLRKLGVNLPSGEEYQWSVTLVDAGDTDQIAAEGPSWVLARAGAKIALPARSAILE